MAKRRYKVTAAWPVFGTEPGETFIADVDKEGTMHVGNLKAPEARLIDRGAIEKATSSDSDK